MNTAPGWRCGRGALVSVGGGQPEASFAGQFETPPWGWRRPPAIRQAVERCLTSAASARAQAYRDEMHAQTDGSMAVVVQRMVDATAAGVIFTADPVTGQRNRIVINAVRGLGEEPGGRLPHAGPFRPLP